MTKIDFTEPSKGTVNSAEAALEINQGDEGGAITAICKKGIGITVDAGSVFGDSGKGISATGIGENGIGVEGKGDRGIGVKGISLNHSGVFGIGKEAGVDGQSNDLNGVGVRGQSEHWFGVLGQSTRRDGVRGETNSMSGSGVAGVHTGGGIGVWGQGKVAGHFEGDVEITRNMNIKGDIEVTGDIKLFNPQHADCAEDFDILEENVEAGTVMVLTENGSLQTSYQTYDKKVAGIVSGAGGYKPAIVLNRQYQSENESQDTKDENKNNQRLPIALMGKVFCKVDARHSPIEIGDLLTTSSTKGYAMKADDLTKAFGAILGKALSSLKEGLGMIPVLVTLQ